MKVYIGNRNIQDDSYRQIPDPEILHHIADDAECNIIILDGVLRRYTLGQVVEILQLCNKKLRLGGIVKIIDIDFDLMIYVYGKLQNVADLNKAIFTSEIRSFLTFDLLLEIVKQYAPEIANLSSSRIQNVEFDMELVRK